jgi:hypothetical protein
LGESGIKHSPSFPVRRERIGLQYSTRSATLQVFLKAVVTPVQIKAYRKKTVRIARTYLKIV